MEIMKWHKFPDEKPPFGEECWISFRQYNGYEGVEIAYFIDDFFGWGIGGDTCDSTVLAWMPIVEPEIYKEKG
jgi:hypothetical protein